MNSIRIGQFAFHIDNGGLLVEITMGNKEDRYKFNPEESTNLLNFLSQHQHDFNAAITPSEPQFGSNEWHNDYLEREFNKMED